MRTLNREILLAFWKIHILHHAAEGPVVGNWMLKELRHHGYDASPGTLYPLLARMEEHGWLSSTVAGSGPKAPRAYRLTEEGAAVLEVVQAQMGELVGETRNRDALQPAELEKTTLDLRLPLDLSKESSTAGSAGGPPASRRRRNG